MYSCFTRLKDEDVLKYVFGLIVKDSSIFRGRRTGNLNIIQKSNKAKYIHHKIKQKIKAQKSLKMLFITTQEKYF